MMETTVIASAASLVVGMIVSKAISMYTNKDAVRARLFRAGTKIAAKLAEMESQTPDDAAKAAYDAAQAAEAKKQFQVAVEKLVA